MYIQQTINIEAKDVAGLSEVAKSGNYSDLKNRPTKLSQFENDLAMGRGGSTGSGGNTYVHPATHPASMITGLSTVATSGKYSDLSGRPTKLSDFTNDIGAGSGSNGGSSYVLPKASSTTLGGIKVGSNLTIDSNGVLSAIIPSSNNGGSNGGTVAIVPNIQIGTVTTLSPGSQATVNRTGTNENPIFNFSIPKGEKGDKGDTGPQGPKGEPGTNSAGSNEYVSVIAHGAVGNGSTYCDQAIMNAYNEAFNTNKTLLIPYGTYRTKSTMTFNKKVNIVMEGVIEQDPGLNLPIISIGGDKGTTLKSIKATLKAKRSISNLSSAWNGGNDMAVLVKNMENSNITIDEASYCRHGVSLCSESSPLFNCHITLGNLYTNKIGLAVGYMGNDTSNCKIKQLTIHGGVINKDTSILTTNSHYNYGMVATGVKNNMLEDIVWYDPYVDLQNAHMNSCFYFSNCNGFKIVNFTANNIREEYLYERNECQSIELIRRNAHAIPVKTWISGQTLKLTTDKYQTVDMKNNITVQLPNVNSFTEIHLIFNATQAYTMTLPRAIRWQSSKPKIEANKTYEFIFTYINSNWVGGCVVYA